jgi:hypothetical protein
MTPTLGKTLTMKPVEAIVSTLEHAQVRPAMFMHDAGRVETVESFLDGFDTACQTLGYSYSKQTFEVVFTRRGWKRFENRAELLSERIGKNMKDSGMSDAEIINELFAIQIECWKSLLAPPVPDAQP